MIQPPQRLSDELFLFFLHPSTSSAELHLGCAAFSLLMSDSHPSRVVSKFYPTLSCDPVSADLWSLLVFFYKRKKINHFNNFTPFNQFRSSCCYGNAGIVEQADHYKPVICSCTNVYARHHPDTLKELKQNDI